MPVCCSSQGCGRGEHFQQKAEWEVKERGKRERKKKN